jgi:hypothetical protein
MQRSFEMLMFLTLAVATAASPTVEDGNTQMAFQKNPGLSEAFRTDSSLKFLRRVPAPEEPQDEAADKAHNAHKDQHKHSKQVWKDANKQAKDNNEQAADKAHNAHKDQHHHSKQAWRDAHEQASDGMKGNETKQQEDPNQLQQAADAVADGLKKAQEALKPDSKEDQEATDEVVDQATDAGGANPIEQIGSAIADAAQDVQNAPMYKVQAEQPEDKEVSSVPGCKNFPKGWADAKGNDCEDYAEGQWCTRHGGYGEGWLDEWGTFGNVTDKVITGKTAQQACCVCGGGFQEYPQMLLAGSAPAAAPAGTPIPGITGPILGSKTGRVLQAQGFSGKLVIHEDAKTMTDDWGREFGPNAGHKDIKTICQDHPGNEWCSLHGYYGYGKKSGAPLKSIVASFLVVLLACL